MGVHCEINLYKPADGAFVPGGAVAGCIKYAVNEETVFNRITISLRGRGRLSMRQKRTNRRRAAHTHRNREEYVNVDNVIHDDQRGQKGLPIGCYETQFSFILPQNIPSSLTVLKNLPRYVVRCHIEYFLSIKFERPGIFKFDKKFKKEITVVSGINPRLSNVPTICGEEKVLTQLFSSKKSVVNIKATVQSCIVRPGDKVEFEYELNNDTNLVISGVDYKLMEVYKFTSRGGREVFATEKIKDTDAKTGSIKSGEVQKMSGEVVVPSDRVTLDFSKIVVRDYMVQIAVNIPFPHRDLVLNIPLQIGYVDGTTNATNAASVVVDAPPTYWEAMAEINEKTKDNTKGDEDGSDDNEAD